MRQVILENGLKYYEGQTKDHGEEHIREVMGNLNKLILMAEKDLGIRLNRELMITAALYHDAGRSIDNEMHHIHSATIVRNEEYLKEIFDEYEIETIATMCAEHRSSNKKECLDLMSALLNDADSMNTLEVIIERIYLYENKLNKDRDEESTFEAVYKHLVDKYGKHGYQKFRTKYARELIDVEGMQKKISMKGEIRKMYSTIVSNIK